jgi:hypothetical protein
MPGTAFTGTAATAWIPLSPTPQFIDLTAPDFTSYMQCQYGVNPTSYAANPRGLGYSTVGMDGEMMLQSLSAMWPNQPAITSCAVGDEGPNVGIFSVPWYDAVGDTESITITPSYPTSSVYGKTSDQSTLTTVVTGTTTLTGNALSQT